MDKQIILNRMRRNPFFIIGSISALLVLILTIFGPMVLQFDPTANSLTEIFVSPEGFSKGLQGHILGTDQMGRDVLMRLLVGGRYSLSIAFIVVFLEVVIGMLLGLAAGYFGGWLDAIIMRCIFGNSKPDPCHCGYGCHGQEHHEFDFGIGLCRMGSCM